MDTCTLYSDGGYDLKTGGTWHLEDSPFKAQQVLRMLARHPEVMRRSICDIGCGAGGVLAALRQQLDGARLTGYDISPQARTLSRQFESEGCQFIQGDPFIDGSVFDLALALDVVEHVEDCFTF